MPANVLTGPGKRTPRAGRSRPLSPAVRPGPRARWRVYRDRVLFGLALLGIWQLVATTRAIDPLAVSSPGAVWKFLRQELKDASFWSNTWATAEATLWATALATAVGVIIGMSLALLPRVEEVVDPYIDAANAMPRIALAPVFVTLFGITMTAKVAMGFSIAVFIVLSATRNGVKGLDVDLSRLFSSLGANKFRRLVKLLLPAAVPAIFGGIRLAVIFSLLGVIASEIIASRDGLGQLITVYSGTFQIAGVYSVVFVLALMATLLNVFMRKVERNLSKWQV